MGIFRKAKKLVIKLTSYFYKRDKRLWVFGEWFGKRCCDNCLYLANYIAEKYPDINLVWIAEKDIDLSLLNKKIKVLVKNSDDAMKTLKRASVIVINQSLDDILNERINCFGNALTINLWHGVPWKKIFLDSMKFNSKKEKKKIINNRKFYEPKYYLALSDDFRDILKSSIPTKEKNIILSGYPRNSLFYDKEIIKDKKEKVVRLVNEKFNKNFDDIKIISYMPTFRDNTRETFSFNELENNEKLQSLLTKYNAIIIQKAHFVNRENSENNVNNNKIFNINDISAQKLLAASDMLITDYSSCFFDYLVLDRPIIHYLYDYDYYVNDDRGVYYKKEDVVCGDVAENIDELINFISINLNDTNNNKELRESRRQKFMKYEDKDSCETICNFIFSKLKIKR